MEDTEVILVDENDHPVGVCEKIKTHQEGWLHRAFSIFIFNRKGEMLLQQRAMNKYHSGGLWSNACCSHPEPGEETKEAAQRRLQEELGFVTPLSKVFDFIYKTELENGLTEHEFDHVFIGEYDGSILFNKDEVLDICYKGLKEVRESMQTHPRKYTAWFRLAFPQVEGWWKNHYKNKIL